MQTSERQISNLFSHMLILDIYQYILCLCLSLSLSLSCEVGKHVELNMVKVCCILDWTMELTTMYSKYDLIWRPIKKDFIDFNCM